MKYADALRRFLGQYPNVYTRRGYEQSLLLLQRYVGESREITKISEADMLDFAEDLRKSYAYNEVTIHKHIKGVKIFFNWLEKVKFITTNPSDALRNPRPPRQIERDKAMTDAELDLILRYAYPDPLKYAVVLFLADTGARAGGVSTLTLANLDLPRQEAQVREKGNKTRPVWFEEECANALRRWLAVRSAVIRLMIERNHGTRDHGFVFCHDQGPHSPDAISQIIYRLGKDAGISRPLGSHALRHRLGHKLADAKVAPSVAATILGHSDVTITLGFYYPNDTARAEEAVRQLGYQSPQREQKILKFGR